MKTIKAATNKTKIGLRERLRPIGGDVFFDMVGRLGLSSMRCVWVLGSEDTWMRGVTPRHKDQDFLWAIIHAKEVFDIEHLFLLRDVRSNGPSTAPDHWEQITI